MAKGISIHIGLNYVDIDHYQLLHRLPFCENDALKMQEIALANNFNTCLLINENATSSNLFYLLDIAATELEKDDILFLSFSGHGSYVQDANGDEEDEEDEALVIYDRMVIDDELALRWTRFRPGVRILFICDSCHSGTVSKDPNTRIKKRLSLFSDRDNTNLLTQTYLRNQRLYDSILKNIPPKISTSIDCTVLLLSACLDSQTTGAGLSSDSGLSTFTEILSEFWNEGRFEGSYYTLHKLIETKMRSELTDQVSQYSVIGAKNKRFEYQRPFTI